MSQNRKRPSREAVARCRQLVLLIPYAIIYLHIFTMNVDLKEVAPVIDFLCLPLSYILFTCYTFQVLDFL